MDGPCDEGQHPMVINGSIEGYIMSPNYPEPYPNDANCQWVIRVPETHAILITILHFDLEYG